MGRYLRSGCRGNVVLRPIVCNASTSKRKKSSSALTASSAKGKGKATASQGDDIGVEFGLFACQDIQPGEELVIGWEWDDGHLMHDLPGVLVDETTQGGSGARYVRYWLR